MSENAPAAGGLPNDVVLKADVQAALLDAIVAKLPVKREDVTDAWKPTDAGADEKGWGGTLAEFAKRLRALKAVYSFYRHKPAYAAATLNKTFAQIVVYLAGKVRAQAPGGAP